jgi:putative ABC transport system permease protein
MRFDLWFTYARRNLRSGLRGFWIFLSCLTLGVSAIAIIGSLASAVQRGLDEQGQPLLGGDLEYALTQREAAADEFAFIKSQGDVTRIATMRAMAQSNGASTLVELKAVDTAYPLYGILKLQQSMPLPFSSVNGSFGVAVDPLLLARLNLKVGNMLKLGNASFTLRAVIETEPDRIADGLIFGPRLMMSHEALQSTGLVQPGSLVTWRYRVKLRGDASLKAGKAAEENAKAKFPNAGWRMRTPDKAAQGADEFIGRLGYFMTLVSIAALTIGGAGIANAVTAFINRRRDSIATLKCLGLPNRDVVGICLTEIMAVSVFGIALALIAGSVSPFIVRALFGQILPLPISADIAWRPLVFAGFLGLLVTLAFALWPLSRISHIQGAALFRSHSMEQAGRPSWGYALASFSILTVAAICILLNFDEPHVTASYLGGLAASFLILAFLAYLIVKGAALLPRPKNLLLRQAVQSLYRPGATSQSVIMALGLGLTLFVTLALTDQTISAELKSGIPDKAPAFFFVDVQNTELDQFRASLKQQEGVTEITNAPMLRGRISKVKGVSSEKVKTTSDTSWALRGDRGLTYAEELPKGSTLTEGKWWPTDYAGPNLVSMTDDIAQGLDLKIGDKITVNVLGRDVDAQVANLRKVNWRSLGINFVMVFTPGTLKAAPHSHIVTVEMKGGDEGKLLNTMAAAYPSVTAVRVKDALTTVTDLLGKMLVAVRGANIITLLTGILVLAGALAAGLSSRSYEAVVLKTYGATRRQLLLAFVIEYGLLGLVAAVFGVVVGSLGSWFLAYYILEMPWVFSASIAIFTALVAMVLTIAAGLTVTARALSAKPSFYLRNE